jgi:HSP20 family protein
MSIFRDIGESLGNTVLENVGRAVGRAQERTPLPVDLLESEEAYLAVFDAPGAESTDVQVQFRDDAVEVRIDRFRAFHEGFEMRYPGRGLALDGHATLPEDAHVDPESATAVLHDNGTLRVRVPRADPEESDAEDWTPKTDVEASEADADAEADDDDGDGDDGGSDSGAADGDSDDGDDSETADAAAAADEDDA